MKTITPLLFLLILGFYPPQKADAQANADTAALRKEAPLVGSSVRSIPRRPAGEIAFANGASLTRSGDSMIIVDSGQRYVMSRKQATPPPPAMMNSKNPCKVVKHWLDGHRAGVLWRSLAIWWADNCL